MFPRAAALAGRETEACEVVIRRAGFSLRTSFFLDAVDNDGDAIRFQHNNGTYFDVIFLKEEQAQEVYGEILAAIREGETLLETDIREKQVT